jgi:hypothetical protein
MKPGDLIRYRKINFGESTPLLGIILNEEPHAVEHRFFNVVLHNGMVKLISDHYLELIYEQKSVE